MGQYLKIIKNGQDISGKGIRDTTKLLNEYLPDLNSSLLGSVIILGQGLPQRFTNNSPSGRKEVLEKLSKSDFMLQDLKDRISSRLAILKGNLRQHEDTALTLRTQQEALQKQINDNTIFLNSLKSDTFITDSINLYEKNILDFTEELEILNSKLESVINCQQETNLKYNTQVQIANEAEYLIKDKWNAQITSAKLESQTKIQEIKDLGNNSLTAIKDKWNLLLVSNKEQEATLKAEISNLNSQITELKNIKDICPTCGQKLPNIHKPDTTVQENELNLKQLELEDVQKYINELTNSCTLELNKQTDYINSEIEIYTKQNIEYINSLTTAYNIELTDCQNKYKEDLAALNDSLSSLNIELSDLKAKINKINNQKKEYEDKVIMLKNELASLAGSRLAAENTIKIAQQTIEENNKKYILNDSEKIVVEKHIEIINKMNSVISRDFRGYLLTNIIDYINKKAKEFSNEIFETDKINFALDGNNIVINYANKEYESLSGGEKAKCDIIIQLALRSMLCKYLDFSSNILVMDEIFDGLDQIGCERVLNLFAKYLNDVQSVFIVTHHQDLQIPADRILTVTKGIDGISSISV